MTKPTGYSAVQIGLHWVVALLIAAQLIFGDGISDAYERVLQGQDIGFVPMAALHVLGGVLIFVFGLWRLVLRLRRGVPAPMAKTPRWQIVASEAVHYALYAVMIIAPLTGAAAWFGGIEAAGDAHESAKPVIVLLVLVHVLAALYHQFIKKDGLLRRMMRAQ